MIRYRLVICFCVAFVFSVLWGHPLSAQTTNLEELIEMDLTDLLNMKIQAATKTEISQLESPQSITVITRKEIDHSAAKSLGELLRGYVGANIVRINSSENLISVRGSNVFSPSQTLLLIDGQAFDTTIFSTTWWDLVPVSLHDIERIEFIRSPGTLYGSNAQNGVINVVTRKAEDQKEDEYFDTVISAGEQGYRKGYAGFSKKTDNLSYRISVQGMELEAYRAQKSKEIIPGAMQPKGEQVFPDDEVMLKNTILSGALQTSVKENPLSLRFTRQDIDTAKGRVPDRLCFTEINGHTELASLDYGFHIGKADQKILLSFTENEIGFLRNNGADNLDKAVMNLSKWGFGYEVKTLWNQNHNLLLGSSYYLENGTNITGVPFFTKEVSSEGIASLYLQDEWDISEKGTVYMGGMYSDHHIGGSSISPMLAYVHRVNDRNVFRIATYTSHRNPNLFESSMDYDQTTGTPFKWTTLVSNPKLDPARTTSYEIGFRSQPIDDLFFSLDVYRNDVKDGMEWDLIGSSGTPGVDLRPKYQTKNNLDQKIVGAEASVRYVLNKNWDIENNVTLTSIENRSSDPDYKGALRLGPNNIGQGRHGADYVPPFLYNLLVNYTRSRLHARFSYQYTAAHTWQVATWREVGGAGVETLTPAEVPEYSLVDLYLGYDVTKKGTIAIEVQNLFDEEHTEWRGDTSFFGRMIWGSIAYRF